MEIDISYFVSIIPVLVALSGVFLVVVALRAPKAVRPEKSVS